MVAVGGLLAATSARYDYHRDELYFRMLQPAWGYVDQPPLTPLLARAATAVFGDTVWAMRIPATVLIAVAILLSALTTRELGGGRTAQGLSAFGFGFAALPLITGHLLITATMDFALWAAVLLCFTRALLRSKPEWFLVTGAIVGVSLYNKLLIGLLLLSLAVALAVVGPRDILRSRWLWAGVGIAVVVGAPNLIYQATHDFPQLAMAGALSENNGGEVRAQLIPFQFLLIGPPLAAVWIAGLVALLRRPQWRPVRAVAVAYLVAVVLAFIGGGQIYYPFGIAAFLLAAGWIPTVDWMARGRARLRKPLVLAALALNAVFSTFIALPVLPAQVIGETPVPDLNPTLADQVGWPAYVRTVTDVYRALPADQQARAVLFTVNYGEAGALVRYGSGLPPVYSGHNQLYYAGPPPEEKTVVIAWTQSFAYANRMFDGCEQKAVLDNGVGVDNEEQGAVVAVCHVPTGGWAALWPRLQHYD
jgi:hypothetical protein